MPRKSRSKKPAAKKARDVRKMPDLPKKDTNKSLNKTSKQDSEMQEEKIDLHAKPAIDKDFLHEMNKKTGDLSNGLFMVTSSNSNTIHIVDPISRKILKDFTESKYSFGNNTLCTTGEYGGVILASHATKTNIICWDFESDKLITSFPCKHLITWMQTFNDGNTCIAGTKNGNIHIWNTQTGEMIADVPTHSEDITALAVSQCNSLLVTACKGGIWKLWKMNKLIQVSSKIAENKGEESEIAETISYREHTESITSVYINKFTNRLFTSSLDKSWIVWDLFSGIKLNEFQVNSPIVCMQVEALESIIYLGCTNKNVYWMETKIDEPSPNPRKKIKKALTGHTHSITTILLSKNESRLIVGTDDGMIYIWNIEDLAEDNEHITLETLKGSGKINNLVSIMKPYCLFGLNTKCGDKSLKPFLTKEGKSVFSKTVKSYQESIPQHIMIPSLEVDLHTLISNPHSKNYLGKSKEEMDSDYWSLSFSHFNQSFKSKKPEAKSIKFAKPLSKSVTIDEEKEPAKYKSSALGNKSALGRRVRGKSTVSKKPKKIQDKSKETIAELKKTIETLKQKVKQKDTKLKEFQNLISDLEKEGED